MSESQRKWGKHFGLRSCSFFHWRQKYYRVYRKMHMREFKSIRFLSFQCMSSFGRRDTIENHSDQLTCQTIHTSGRHSVCVFCFLLSFYLSCHSLWLKHCLTSRAPLYGLVSASVKWNLQAIHKQVIFLVLPYVTPHAIFLMLPVPPMWYTQNLAETLFNILSHSGDHYLH